MRQPRACCDRSRYEPPASPELRIDTVACTPEAAADRVIVKLRELSRID